MKKWKVTIITPSVNITKEIEFDYVEISDKGLYYKCQTSEKNLIGLYPIKTTIIEKV